ncbi:NAD(P)H-dependent glycerol-3-phosphate dehydrogenase [Allofournierella sp.]|uniref:NAD(P)H-dependent glycerol-3-phosphate dehydrogenase n=1 Tax=Allofournierella sp. TaxID=1940256 RepID=UPI003AB76068
MKLTVLGCGRWGTFLACYHSEKNDVLLWGRPGSKSFAALQRERKNAYLALPPQLRLESELSAALAFAQVVIISISAQQLRDLARHIARFDVTGKTFILCMKGIEVDSGKRLTQVFCEEVRQPVGLAVWVGPGHVQDFSAGIPNCMVVDSADPATTDFIVEHLNSDLIRLYKGRDLIGTEVGAAAKNVIGIAAGMLDGAGYSSLKGALMARGAREIARLIRAMGGNELSAYGLCHLGDYEATLFSAHSHNRRFGESFIKGEPFDQLAEGASTVKALVCLGKEYEVDLPICRTVYGMLYEKRSAAEALPSLFSRTVKGEFDY